MNEIESQAIFALTELLEEEQKQSRYTGLGYGFNRWILSYKLVQKLEWNYDKVRKVFKGLAERKLIDKRQTSARGMLKYSTLGWEGHHAIGNYFIENNKEE